jgi:hypothetical protein
MASGDRPNPWVEAAIKKRGALAARGAGNDVR